LRHLALVATYSGVATYSVATDDDDDDDDDGQMPGFPLPLQNIKSLSIW
jgi:hypothetical protein